MSAVGGFAPLMADQLSVPAEHPTIAHAIASAADGDTITIATGTYNEAVVVTKPLTILGLSSAVTISPSSGTGITVSANNVVLKLLRVTRCNGISASNVSNLSLVNVSCDSNTTTGAQFTNVNGLAVSGCTFSYNHNEGVNTLNGSNYTITSSFADSNGTGSNGSGLNLKGISGVSSVTSLTAIGNKVHGLSLSSGTSNVTINGGTFNYNGSGRGDGTGGGISVFASGGTLLSNISIAGYVDASNNTTAGIWFNAASASDTIKSVSVGATGQVTMTNNGGAGVIILGNVKNGTITGIFTKGSAFATGILIVGTNIAGANSPINTSVNLCTFAVGYLPNQPAISLSAGVYPYASHNPVSADSNHFLGTSTAQDIEDLIFHYPDDPGDNLGLVTHSHDNPLPVELMSFSASVRGRKVELRWNTASESNNYGFDVERGAIANRQSTINGWANVGFLHGKGTTNVPQSYNYDDEVQSAGTYQYRLKQIDRDGKFSYSNTIEAAVGLTPSDYLLSQNYPNPFNPTTKIRFGLKAGQFAEVKVFNVLGENVRILFSGIGRGDEIKELLFDGSGLPSGVYYYSLRTDERFEVKKMQLVK